MAPSEIDSITSAMPSADAVQYDWQAAPGDTTSHARDAYLQTPGNGWHADPAAHLPDCCDDD
jgi:hypothetical protein